jgi:hypothetical protein
MPWEKSQVWKWVDSGKSLDPVSTGKFTLALHDYEQRGPWKPKMLRAHGPWCAGPSSLELTLENLAQALEGVAVDSELFCCCVLRDMPRDERRALCAKASAELNALQSDEWREWQARIQGEPDVKRRFEIQRENAAQFRPLRAAVLWALVADVVEPQLGDGSV